MCGKALVGCTMLKYRIDVAHGQAVQALVHWMNMCWVDSTMAQTPNETILDCNETLYPLPFGLYLCSLFLKMELISFVHKKNLVWKLASYYCRWPYLIFQD